MKALLWEGVNKLGVEQVPDPRLVNDQDVIVKVARTVTCGSDLHLIGGYIPFMRAGDVVGHEFLGEVVEVGGGLSDREAGVEGCPVPPPVHLGYFERPAAP